MILSVSESREVMPVDEDSVPVRQNKYKFYFLNNSIQGIHFLSSEADPHDLDAKPVQTFQFLRIRIEPLVRIRAKLLLRDPNPQSYDAKSRNCYTFAVF